MWAEALDGGDWNVKVPARDKVMLQKAPFTAPAARDRAHRAALRRLPVGRAAEHRPPARVRREPPLDAHLHHQCRRSASEAAPALGSIRATSTTRTLASPVYRQLANGSWVMRQDGDAIFLSGRARRLTAIGRSSTASISRR